MAYRPMAKRPDVIVFAQASAPIAPEASEEGEEADHLDEDDEDEDRRHGTRKHSEKIGRKRQVVEYY